MAFFKDLRSGPARLISADAPGWVQEERPRPALVRAGERYSSGRKTWLNAQLAACRPMRRAPSSAKRKWMPM
jgi:hypothetical protein